MSTKSGLYLLGLAIVPATALMVACGSGSGSGVSVPSPGSVVVFGTDASVCNVESFVVTITSAKLVPQGGGQLATLISSPATVNFGRLANFTNILSTAEVNPGKYNQVQMTLANPQLAVLDTSTNPPTPQRITTTLTSTSLTLTINPALVVSASTTSGLTLDLDLRKSLQVQGGTGQVTGTVTPQFTLSANVNSGSTVGEATSLYGIIQSVSTASLPAGFTGRLTIVPTDGTGQALTILTNGNTVFEGDGVTNFSNLVGNTFAEVDATVNTGGQIVAQVVDSEEQLSSSSLGSAILGKVLAVLRDGSGNATSLVLLTEDEAPYDAQQPIFPLFSPIVVTLTNGTNYFTNWQNWNRQDFRFGPQTLGPAENLAVFGAIGTGDSLVASQVFLRPANVVGNFTGLQAAGSDGLTGAFTMVPCGALFGGRVITVLTYPDSLFTGVGGLVPLTSAPTLNTTGLLFYEPASGTSNTGGSWTAATWVVQANGIHQLPN